jgi:hypothetical protein
VKRILLFVVSICSLCLLSGCGGGSSAPTRQLTPPPVTPAAASATHFSISAQISATAGTAFSFTVTALDATNNVVATYSGTVHFTSLDPSAVLPADSRLTNGTATLQATLKTAGSQTIMATDTTHASITGNSNTINVGAGPASHFVVSTPASAIAGSLFSFTVTAFDASNNTATGYSGTVRFTSSDSSAVLPLLADSTLTNGTENFPATLKTVGGQTITAKDTVTPSITGTSKSISVSAATPENPVPFINQPLSPDATLPGGVGFTLTVNGTGFVSGSLVNWNGKPRVTSLVSESKLTAAILNSDIVTASTAQVTVVNPAPGGGTSNVAFLEVTLPTSSIALNTASEFTAGPAPSSIATSDVNADGKLDLVVANAGGTVSVLLGNGDGTFRSAVSYNAGTSPLGVAVGDFNGDGKLDLVVANAGGTVSVLLGNGDGTFQAGVNYAAGLSPQSVAVGDFNSDGKLDLVVVNQQSDDVSILLGNGDGTFEAALDYSAGSQPVSVAVGDFNADGKLDLVVANAGGTVSVLLGNGDGTFRTAVNYNAGTFPISLAVADFNGDGKLDLAVANNGSSNVSVLLGNGDGTFQAAMNFGTTSFPSSLAVADFNGDGKLDVAVTASSSSGNNDVSVLLGNGDGTLQPAVNFAVGAQIGSVALGDFNGDGRLDFAIANRAKTTVSILLQDDSLGFSTTSLGFGTQLVGIPSGSQMVMMTNIGFSPIAISSIVIVGANAGDFGQTENCGSGLAAGAKCLISVTFTPSQPGPRNASIQITDSASGSPQSVALSGTGQAPGPNVTLSTASLTFIPQIIGITGSAQDITLSNFGTAALSITSITVSANFGETHTCGSSLASGMSCVISVTSTPTSSGTLLGTLLISDDAPGSPQHVSLSGIGAIATTATLSPNNLVFFCVASLIHTGCTPPQIATLMNTGASTLYVQGISISGLHFSQTNNCSSTLAPGQSCAITLSFDGPASRTQPKPKTFTGSLLVLDTTTQSPQKVSLMGTTSGVP